MIVAVVECRCCSVDCLVCHYKDFTEMIVHHIATITLMSMSWSANMVRVGTLVLCVHDAVDYILEVSHGGGRTLLFVPCKVVLSLVVKNCKTLQNHS